MLPGSFTTPHRALATVVGESETISARELDLMVSAFVIGCSRTYYEAWMRIVTMLIGGIKSWDSRQLKRIRFPSPERKSQR